MDVKFLRGLHSNYTAIESKDQGTFYITGQVENSFDSIYLGTHLLGTTLASGIVLTGYNLGEGKSTSAGISASDTVLSAIQKLDLALSNATGADHAVVSFGGKTGAITVAAAGEGHNVSLTMNENELQANVDLSAYALADHNHDDKYASIDHNHDDVYQKILTAGNYINIDADNNITTVQAEIDSETEGLITNKDVKTYVDAQVKTVTDVLTWGTF